MSAYSFLSIRMLQKRMANIESKNVMQMHTSTLLHLLMWLMTFSNSFFLISETTIKINILRIIIDILLIWKWDLSFFFILSKIIVFNELSGCVTMLLKFEDSKREFWFSTWFPLSFFWSWFFPIILFFEDSFKASFLASSWYTAFQKILI